MPESKTAAVTETSDESSWGKRFLTNILWSWIGVLAGFFTGFFLQPYIIRKLGDHRYGIWALAFAFIDYALLFDFGFKSAIIKRLSMFKTQSAEHEINETLSSAMVYFVTIGVVITGGTWLVSPYLHLFFKISPEYQAEFIVLVRTIAFGWAASVMVFPFIGGMQAFQLFKKENHIYIIQTVIRSGGCALALLFGFGLTTMGFVILVAQLTSSLMIYFAFRQAFPPLRISRSLARLQVWKEMAQYGYHAFVAGIGTILLNQGPSVVVGHFLPEVFVGYYALPSRLLNYMVDMVTRIGFVTMPNAAEMAAKGLYREIIELGMYLNRYCFALFLPLVVFLSAYGKELIGVWVGPGFAEQAAPLLLPFLFSTAFATAGQFNSSQILFGLAKHETYGKCLVVEALVGFVGIALVLPHFGILGAAWVVAGLAILDRGIVTPLLLCRTLQFSLLQYLRAIYGKPVLAVLPLVPYAFWLQRILPGHRWIELLSALALIAAPFYLLAFFVVTTRNHRMVLQTWVQKQLRLSVVTA